MGLGINHVIMANHIVILIFLHLKKKHVQSGKWARYGIVFVIVNFFSHKINLQSKLKKRKMD
jgi:hypothetical protein